MAIEPEPTGQGSAADGVGRVVGEARLTLANVVQQARPGILLPPLILLVAVFFVAYFLRPSETTPVAHSDYEYFFSAAATVLGTILIAIVLQANLFRGPSLRRMLVYGLLYITLAEAAALIALLPGGSEQLQGVLFGLTVSAGLGALGAVLFIGIRLLESPGPELEIQSDGSAVIDDSEDNERPEEADATPPRTVRGDRDGRRGDGDPERRARRERARAAARAGRPESFVVLHADAVSDLENLGKRESAMLLAITERSLGSERMRRRVFPVDEEWSELRAGGLRVVFRPLTPEEASERGRDRGFLVRRILAGPAAQKWLSEAAARGPGDRFRRTDET